MIQSIEQQTGWKRPGPKTICQDPNALLAIYEYDYDLDNDEFRKHFTARTGIVITKDCSQRCDEEVETTWEKNLKGRLQDAWELFLSTLEPVDEIKLAKKAVQLDLFF